MKIEIIKAKHPSSWEVYLFRKSNNTLADTAKKFRMSRENVRRKTERVERLIKQEDKWHDSLPTGTSNAISDHGIETIDQIKSIISGKGLGSIRRIGIKGRNAIIDLIKKQEKQTEKA